MWKLKLKIMKEICKGCGKERFIVNKTHKLCASCNKKRLDAQKQTGGTKVSKPKKIRSMSLKMAKNNKQYIEIRERKRKFQKENGYYKCFFTGKPLDDETMIIDCHHANGRDGDNLAKWENLFFAIREYHREYHDLPVNMLLQTWWYNSFLERMRKINHKVYNHELRRLNKGGVIDDDQFFKMYISEDVQK